MTIEEIRIEILKVCFRPGNSPAVNVSDAKVYETYVLDKKDSTIPADLTKKVGSKK